MTQAKQTSMKFLRPTTLVLFTFILGTASAWPLIKIKTGVHEDFDKKQQRVETTTYKYPMLNSDGFWGVYVVVNKYNKKGELVSKSVRQERCPSLEFEGQHKIKSKTTFFDKKGEKAFIKKSKRLSGSLNVIMDKSVYYREDGTIIRSNNLKGHKKMKAPKPSRISTLKQQQ